MPQTVIRVEKLGKRYRIGATARQNGLRHLIGDALGAPLQFFRGAKQDFTQSAGHSPANRASGAHSNACPKPRGDDFIWALRDVGFEVRQGEVVGLIGRNGAGKSTLLKVLARITQPTHGYAEIRGRVGSLLEVGTGFHSELTGRENVYMSGAILGMRKAEIDRKFDEIVAFSEVERFLETPLKRYSSGMQMRLAFAVAAHLEPEILFVDEVLAVGDAAFQKKCLGKMSEVASHGRTILFVSHNVAAVSRICNRCILLSSGTVLKDGPTHDVMNSYLRAGVATPAARFWNLQDAPGDGVVRLRAVRARTDEDNVAETFDIRNPIGIDVIFDVTEAGDVLTPNLHIFNEEGVNVFVSIDGDPIWQGRPRPMGRYISTAWIPGNFLAEGTFFVGAAITNLASMNVRFYERDAIAFQVIDSTTGDSARRTFAGHLPGVVRPLLTWKTLYELEPSDHWPAGDTNTGEKVLP
jgi:homopolymeric O-antigen transport system ATP-binding protein